MRGLFVMPCSPQSLSRAKLTLRGFGSFKRDAFGALTFKSSVRAPRLVAENAVTVEAVNEASEMAKE